MQRISVSNLTAKQDAQSSFYVKYIALMSAKDGKKYLNIILSDATGDLESRIWNNAEKIYEQIAKGSFVEVEGKVNIYQGRKQFVISEINKISEDDVDLKEFIMSSTTDPEDNYNKLLKIVEGMQDVYIRDLLQAILNDTEIARRLKKWQAGKSIHHAYQGGLVEHILSCTELAISLSKVYNVNENYVIAGAILHDICKIYELTDDISVEYTEEGKLVGHLVKGVELVDRFSFKIKDFPYQLKLHLKHILLSHHGEYAYGSPKIPQTREAMLVHLIDLMDSKMHSFETAIKADKNSGHWTSFIKHLDRIIFKEELPFFPEYVSKQEVPETKKKKSSELTHSLADALKDIKVKN